MGIIREFKEFAVRGNMVDMAVGIILGAAFGRVVSSLVSDVLMPPLGLVIGDVHFSELAVTLREARDDAAAITLNYGAFLEQVLDLTFVALALFAIVKGVNVVRRGQAQIVEQPKTVPMSTEEKLLSEIRDLLRQGAVREQ